MHHACVDLWDRLSALVCGFGNKQIMALPSLSFLASGVAKGGPGQAHARPKHHVRAACHAISCEACEANGLAYSRCLANTNDLATPLFLATSSGGQYGIEAWSPGNKNKDFTVSTHYWMVEKV